MELKITKVNHLSPKDIHILETLIINNFNKTLSFNTLYPEKKDTATPQRKLNYFDYLLKTKRDVSFEYIDNYFQKKYKELVLSKERILVEVMELITECKKAKDYGTALQSYKYLGELLGYNITSKALNQVNPNVLIIQVGNQEGANLIQNAIDTVSTISNVEYKALNSPLVKNDQTF